MKIVFQFLICLVTSVTIAAAQDIPLKQESDNTYSFSLGNAILIQDFEIVSGEKTPAKDVYLVTVRALTPDKQTDESIRGKLLFEINGENDLVLFRNGLGQVEVNLKGSSGKLVMKDVDSGITRTAELKKTSWYWAFLLIPGLLVLYFIFRKIRK